MAITINYLTKVISVPRADMLLLQTVPTEIRELDLIAFRNIIKAFEDDETGISYDITHNWFPSQTVGGVQLAPVLVMVNGYTVTFEDGQYAVNFKGANTNLQDVTNVNQVSIRPSNSAGLVQTREIEFILFDGAVTIDQNNVTGKAVAGQANPIGTHLMPVNNITDALFIANLRGFNTLRILGNLNVAAIDVLDDLTVIGDNPSQTIITFVAGCSTKRTRFLLAELTGTLNGALEINGCHIEALAGVGGNSSETNIVDCIIELGGITFSNSNTQHVHIINCKSGPPDSTFVPINFNGVGGNLTIAQWNGQFELQNMTNGQNVKVFTNSGRARFANTCTLGTIHVHGSSEVTNLAGVGVTVVDKTIDSAIDRIKKILLNKKLVDPATGAVTIMDDDSVTTLFSGIAYEDIGGLQTYRGQGYDRVDRLV